VPDAIAASRQRGPVGPAVNPKGDRLLWIDKDVHWCGFESLGWQQGS
jgi:hypothetical protein